jgi:HAD superfamily hydrolase (TIGR01490 family)
MKIAMFDLDNTILSQDSEVFWSTFLYTNKLVDDSYIAQIHAFYSQYEAGTLEINAYQQCFMAPLVQHGLEKILIMRELYLGEIKKFIRPMMSRLVRNHQAQGHVVLLVSASSSFLVEPIAALLEISQVISTDVRIDSTLMTATIVGVPAFREGKVKRVQTWLAEQAFTVEESWFYSDSINDLPLLQTVTHPVVVTPDASLLFIAQQQGWEILVT